MCIAGEAVFCEVDMSSNSVMKTPFGLLTVRVEPLGNGGVVGSGNGGGGGGGEGETSSSSSPSPSPSPPPPPPPPPPPAFLRTVK